ncbi:hypothetical protein AAC387_Pa11g1906 [Persea americana]
MKWGALEIDREYAVFCSSPHSQMPSNLCWEAPSYKTPHSALSLSLCLVPRFVVQTQAQYLKAYFFPGCSAFH